jgi:hypothetical protein
MFHLDDIDEIARTAEKDMVEATFRLEAALQTCKTSPGQQNLWPNLLLTQLASNVLTGLGTSAAMNGLAREGVAGLHCNLWNCTFAFAC